MQNKAFDYYAFISYNHKDAKWAKRLQRQLEHYRLPSALCREQPDLPKRITPVFLDSSDLVARSSLLDSLRAKLDASNYLIVLCSPNSAVSPWVNDEVEYFIRTGRKDRIIPLIIDGEPHAAVPARECYPPALAALPSHEELLGIDIRAHGRRGAFLRVIATLLDLKLDRVIARDAAVQRRRFALYACALLLAAAGIFSLAWYNTPHTAYYVDYTYAWEKPVGIQEVPSGQRKQMDYTYRFTTLRGDVVQVERVNSAGVLTGGLSLVWEDPPSMRFYYGMSDQFGGRTVTRVSCCDLYGRELYEKHYSADLSAVDFVQSGNGGASFSLGTDLLSSQAAVGINGSGERGDVIRYIQSYDENGYLIRRMFKRDNRGSSGGTPTRDENGVWGVGFLRDGLGRVAGTRFLDRDGTFMADKTGCAGFDYTYGACGRVDTETCLGLSGAPAADKNNIAQTKVEYDELGRLVEMARFDANGGRVDDASSGVSVFRHSYDGRGFLTSTEYYNHMLEPCCDTLGMCRTVGTPDSSGRIVRVELYGPDGEPLPCGEGYAGWTNAYDPDGLLTQRRYFGAAGRPAPTLSLNVYGENLTWSDGLHVRTDYVDGEGRPMTCKYGVASICWEYNGERQVSREWYLDENGEPVRYNGGYAEVRCSYTDGNCTGYDCYDETGAPCRDSSGVASYANTYEFGQLTGQSCYGPEGEPVLNSDGWHRLEQTFDEGGLLLRECYFGTEGERVTAGTGYSAIGYTYDAAGRVAGETYYNTQDQKRTPMGSDINYYSATQLQFEYDQRGNQTRVVFVPRTEDAKIPGMVWDVAYGYDDYGNLVRELWRDIQGAPVLNRSGYASYEAKYDGLGRAVDRRWYDAQGALTGWDVLSYDGLGRNTQVASLAADGSRQLVEDNVYDEFGRCVQRSYTDKNGQLCMNSYNFALARAEYDVFGNMTELWTYDEAGNPCEDVFRESFTYTATGKMLTASYYGADEQLLERVACTYDSYDRLTEKRQYRGDGSCIGWISYVRNSRGEVMETIYYNPDGSVMNTQCSGFYISEVFPDTPAAEAGIQAGDLVIVYNLWSLSSTLADPDASFELLSEMIQAGADVEKHIVVGRYNEDRTKMTFVELTLPVGKAGVIIADETVYSSLVKAVLDAYEQWVEAGSRPGAFFSPR